jgi:hypothetical protein
LIVQAVNLPLMRFASTIKPPPWRSDRAAKAISVGAAFPDEDLAALIGVCGPGSGQFERADVFCRNQYNARQHHCEYAQSTQLQQSAL